jgi:hypothetical protein
MPHTTAIAGVNSQRETVLTNVWPSVAANPLGRLIGRLNQCIPLKINGIAVSAMIFGLPLAPLGALIYLGSKLFGVRYTLTNRSIQVWSAAGGRLQKSIPLGEVGEIEFVQTPGQAFFKAADVQLLSSNGSLLLKLPGISYPEVFTRNLREAQQAAALTTAALETIKKRG